MHKIFISYSSQHRDLTRALAPYVERYPRTYRDLARTIRADILRYSEAAGQQPDSALLAQVAKALGNGEAVEED